jgi:hypothetical protein
MIEIKFADFTKKKANAKVLFEKNILRNLLSARTSCLCSSQGEDCVSLLLLFKRMVTKILVPFRA